LVDVTFAPAAFARTILFAESALTASAAALDVAAFFFAAVGACAAVLERVVAGFAGCCAAATAAVSTVATITTNALRDSISSSHVESGLAHVRGSMVLGTGAGRASVVRVMMRATS